MSLRCCHLINILTRGQQQTKNNTFGLRSNFKSLSSSSSFSSSSSAWFSSGRHFSSTNKNNNNKKVSTTTEFLKNPHEMLLEKTDIFISDLDGVIWRGDTVIEGIPLVVEKLRKLGKKIYFVTNNSTKSRKGYLKKFQSMGIDADYQEIFSSSFAVAAYLERIDFKSSGKKVYVVGETGIQEELDELGVPWIGGELYKDKQVVISPDVKFDHDPNVGAVVVGLDRNINYHKLNYAQLCINNNPGCEFIATNRDAVVHLTDSQEWAGAGSIVNAVVGCTGRQPNLVGKPSPLMVDYICDKFDIKDRSRICMIGDRLDTDMLFGLNNGLKTLLTLSGVTSKELLFSEENKVKPDYYVNTINDLFV